MSTNLDKIIGNFDRKFLYEDHVCTHYGYLVCPYDRNLPLYLSCTDPIRNDEQQRVGTDRNELFQRTLCPGIPGISDDGMCCYLCSISGRHPVFG